MRSLRLEAVEHPPGPEPLAFDGPLPPGAEPVLLPVAAPDAARFPCLAGAGLAVVAWGTAEDGAAAPGRLAVHPEVEVVFYRHADGQAVVLPRALLTRFLAEGTPEHLSAREVRLGSSALSTAALTDATRILGFESGQALVGLVVRAGPRHE